MMMMTKYSILNYYLMTSRPTARHKIDPQ